MGHCRLELLLIQLPLCVSSFLVLTTELVVHDFQIARNFPAKRVAARVPLSSDHEPAVSQCDVIKKAASVAQSK